MSARGPGLAVSLAGVSRIYGPQRALESVDLRIEPGEWLAVMGPSGSGKTTLLNLLGGLDRPDEGTILVGGEDVGALDDSARARYRRERIGLVFQQFHLLPYLTALENVMLAQHYHSMADEAEARQALVRVGLEAKLHARPGRMSGGEQQRVCIARALINQPGLILADEPTGNLDEENARTVLEIFARLHRAGHTIVLVTHDPEVGALADRRVELHHGRLSTVSPTTTERDERCDHFLEEMWYLWEEGRPLVLSAVRAQKVPDHERTAQEVTERGLVLRAGDGLAFTERGVVRARDLVRRHRLAECLFATAIHLEDPNLDATACRMEHILDPEVTEGICTFLKHPAACPHGKPVPAGPCCPAGGARAAVPAAVSVLPQALLP
ncbi:MAG: ATP-binding cassette domain-containing protein [Candidatus Eiseniibacteriota bacterium]